MYYTNTLILLKILIYAKETLNFNIKWKYKIHESIKHYTLWMKNYLKCKSML